MLCDTTSMCKQGNVKLIVKEPKQHRHVLLLRVHIFLPVIFTKLLEFLTHEKGCITSWLN